MLAARIASRAASAFRSRAALAASACRGCAALTARHLSDAAAKQHERALEALDAGAPPEAVVPLFEAAAAEGHAEATFFVGLAKAGLLEPDDGTVGGSPPEVDLEGAAAAYAKAAELGLPIAIVNRGGTRAERAGLGRVLKLEGPSSEILTGAVVSAGS